MIQVALHLNVSFCNQPFSLFWWNILQTVEYTVTSTIWVCIIISPFRRPLLSYVRLSAFMASIIRSRGRPVLLHFKVHHVFVSIIMQDEQEIKFFFVGTQNNISPMTDVLIINYKENFDILEDNQLDYITINKGYYYYQLWECFGNK